MNGQRRALLVWGGWTGHEPSQVADLFASDLRAQGFVVTLSDTLDVFLDGHYLRAQDLIVPLWTMGTITNDQLRPLLDAVAGGVGLAGCHGGLCDAFRDATEYQFMTGGQWVAHPGNDGVTYSVQVTQPAHPIMSGTPATFTVCTEQYYMHVDPANTVLATTLFPTPGVDGRHLRNGPCAMPVVWTRYYGEGRVFYCSLGHHADVIADPTVRQLCTRGLLWAAGADDQLAQLA